MPTLNPSLPGVYAAGVAGDGGIISVNSQHIFGPNAGGNPDMHGPDWLNGVEVFCKTYPPEQLIAVNWQTNAVRTLYEGQVSDFCAGGWRFAAITLRGVIIGQGVEPPAVYHAVIAPTAFGPDGTLAYRRWHQDGLILCPPDRLPNPDVDLELVPSNVRVEDVQVFGNTRVLWRRGRTIHGYGLFGLTSLELPFDFGWVRGVQVGGRWLLICQRYDMGVIVFYANDPSQGWKLTAGGLCYRPDIGLSGGRVRAVWSRVSRDHPDDLTVLDWALHEPMVPFDETSVPIPEPPPPPPPPEPEPTVPVPNLLDTVKAVRAKYPQPSQADLGAMLNEIAWIHREQGFGLSRKPGGNHTIQPRTGERISVDVLHHKPTRTLWDCFGDAGGATTPSWNEAEWHGDDSRIWLPPVEPVGGVEPEPPPPPPPPPPDDSELERLRAELAEAKASRDQVLIRVGELEREVDALKAEVAALLARPEPRMECAGRIFGVNYNCKLVR